MGLLSSDDTDSDDSSADDDSEKNANSPERGTPIDEINETTQSIKEQDITIPRRKLLSTGISLSPIIFAGCLGLGENDSEPQSEGQTSTTEQDTPTNTETPTTEQNSDNQSQESVFSDYYVDGDEFVVEVNPDAENNVTEVILHYNENYRGEHPTQNVEGISVARFNIVPDGKNDPIEGTWTIEAVSSNTTVETVEYNAEKSLSLSKVGTGVQSSQFDHTNQLEESDLQFTLTNDGDIPDNPYSLKLNRAFADTLESSGSKEVLGLERNTEPMLVPGDSLEFRMSGATCFDEIENAEEWTGQTAQASIIVDQGSTSGSWTFPITIDMGTTVEQGDYGGGCVMGSTVTKRE